mmetsp:Transcript_14237/g.49323  ORF Transcript_14237/g.49323 Transcript_14237/m.49323 type:complete len:232 (-) Transcript_14237:861-1556(-)
MLLKLPYYHSFELGLVDVEPLRQELFQHRPLGRVASLGGRQRNSACGNRCREALETRRRTAAGRLRRKLLRVSRRGRRRHVTHDGERRWSGARVARGVCRRGADRGRRSVVFGAVGVGAVGAAQLPGHVGAVVIPGFALGCLPGVEDLERVIRVTRVNNHQNVVLPVDGLYDSLVKRRAILVVRPDAQLDLQPIRQGRLRARSPDWRRDASALGPQDYLPPGRGGGNHRSI